MKQKSTALSSLLIVPQEDLSCLEGIPVPVEILMLRENGKCVTLGKDAKTLSIHELVSRCIGFVVSSHSGLLSARELVTSMTNVTSEAALPLCDLSNVEPGSREAVVLRFIVEGFNLISQLQLHRLSELSRSIVVLRETHQRMQFSFSKLEKFVFDKNLSRRILSLALLPGKGIAPLALAKGQILTQRLPISSIGLSDVAIFIDQVDIPDQGTLSVSLMTNENNTLHAHWTLPSQQLAKGLLRLAMYTALGGPELTPYLEISWKGEGQIKLSSSLYHPDSRFQSRIGELADPRVLAIRCWSCVPGCDVQVTTNAYLPDDLRSSFLCDLVIDDIALSSAENLTPTSLHSQYLEDRNAVLVHPMPEGTSVMRIASSIPAGAGYINAKIRNLNEQSSVIEFALAISPSNENRKLIEHVFDLSSRTPWVALSPMGDGEIHFPLDDALSCEHDLYLITQLAEQPGDSSFGWAIFERIKVSIRA